MSIKKLGLALAVSALASGANAALYVSGDDAGNTGGSSLLFAAYDAATTTTLYVDLNALAPNNRVHTFDGFANQSIDLSSIAAANSFSLANVQWTIVGGDSVNLGGACALPGVDLTACGQTYMTTVDQSVDSLPASATQFAITTAVNSVNNGWFLNVRGAINTGNGHSTTVADGSFGQWVQGLVPAEAFFDITAATGESLDFATASYVGVLNTAGTRINMATTGEFAYQPGFWTLSPESTLTYSAVPVPAALWMFASGLVGLAGVARRRKQA